MDEIYKELSKLDIKKGPVIRLGKLSSESIAKVEQILDKPFITVKKDKHTLKFTVDPIEEAKAILHSNISKREGQCMIGVEIPGPGIEWALTNVRILYTAKYLLNARRMLGMDCVAVGIPYIDDLELGYLIMGFERFGNDEKLLNNDAYKYLIEIVKKAKLIVPKEEAQMASKRVLVGEHQEIFERVYGSWRNSVLNIIQDNDICLVIPEHLDQDFAQLDIDTTESAFVHQSGRIALLSKKYQIYNQTFVFHSKHLWKYQAFQKYFKQSGQFSLVPIAQCGGIEIEGLGSDFFASIFKICAQLVAEEAQADPNTSKANVLGHSYFLFQLLSRKSSTKITFEDYRVENENTNVGVYIQYTYSRICGIERNLDNPIGPFSSLDGLNVTPKVFDLIRFAGEFESFLERSMNEPSVMVTYLLHLSRMISSQYHHLRVKDEQLERQEARWAVLLICKRILDNGISLFGLNRVSEM